MTRPAASPGPLRRWARHFAGRPASAGYYRRGGGCGHGAAGGAEGRTPPTWRVPHAAVTGHAGAGGARPPALTQRHTTHKPTPHSPPPRGLDRSGRITRPACVRRTRAGSAAPPCPAGHVRPGVRGGGGTHAHTHGPIQHKWQANTGREHHRGRRGNVAGAPAPRGSGRRRAVARTP